MMETWSFRPTRGGRPIYVPRNTAGTTALSGFSQVISSDAGTWKFLYESIPLKNSAAVERWDTLALLLEGRLVPFLVPLCEGKRQPWPVSNKGEILSPSFTRRKHLAGTIYEDPAIPVQSQIIARVHAAVALRATTLTIRMQQGSDPRTSQFFSLGDRLYQIRSIVSVVDNQTTVTIRPPLREAVTANTIVNFQAPVCKVRLATDAEMERVLDQNRLGLQTVTMLEDPTT